jgi:adenylosuccinate synthase
VSLWVVVGGQYGSEGKGKVAAHISEQERIDICVRCGGPNSGHSVTTESGTVVVRQVPAAFARSKTRLLIAAGGLVDLKVLRNEITALGLGPDRLGIDGRTMVIEEYDRRREAELALRERLSSTLCGVGSAVARRALRGAEVQLMKDAAESETWLAPYLTDVAEETHRKLHLGGSVLIEGTQGFGLSLYHSDQYPKATSRDTTAAAFLSEVGLSPFAVSEIVLVLRTFPIRVAGVQAGALYSEITWEQLQRESGYPFAIHEYTSVSNRLRRLGRFDWNLAGRAVMYNRPSQIAINGFDYLTYADFGKAAYAELSRTAREFIDAVEERFGIPVTYCGTGPSHLLARNVSLGVVATTLNI